MSLLKLMQINKNKNMGIDNSYADLNLHLAVNKTNCLPWPNVKYLYYQVLHL